MYWIRFLVLAVLAAVTVLGFFVEVIPQCEKFKVILTVYMDGTRLFWEVTLGTFISPFGMSMPDLFSDYLTFGFIASAALSASAFARHRYPILDGYHFNAKGKRGLMKTVGKGLVARLFWPIVLFINYITLGPGAADARHERGRQDEQYESTIPEGRHKWPWQGSRTTHKMTFDEFKEFTETEAEFYELQQSLFKLFLICELFLIGGMTIISTVIC